jgi:hypothetical protein
MKIPFAINKYCICENTIKLGLPRLLLFFNNYYTIKNLSFYFQKL